jgi:hypothetical protein
MINVHGRPVSFLIDTCSNVSILNKSVFDKLNLNVPLEKVNLNMLTATGDIAPFYGKITAEISLEKQVFNHDILLADIKNDGILGIDIIELYTSEIKRELKIGNNIIKCSLCKGEIGKQCYRKLVTENVIIPPGKEMIIPRKSSVNLGNSDCVIEPNLTYTEKSGLLVGESLVKCATNVLPIKVIKCFFNNKDCTV